MRKRVAVELGKRHGRLVVIAVDLKMGRHPASLVRCDCGSERPMRNYQLSGRKPPVSCGCRQARHGHARKVTGRMTPEYRAWRDMHHRCEKPNNRRYASYGGRGIRVCARWSQFENFFEDMGKRPTPNHSLDRLDNDGDYTVDETLAA